MKTGGSSLNPHAAAYVPLSKRGVSDQDKDFVAAQAFQTGNENVWHGNQPANTWKQGQQQNVYKSHVHAGAFNTGGVSKWKDHDAAEFNASSSQYLHEMPGKSNVIEELDMDLAYLQMTFPGISEESLSDVYFASNYDLDAAVDMLDQLELHPDDSFGKLPDNLGIGDVPGSGPPSGLASPKSKNATAEASTSGSSNLSTTT